MTNFIDKELQLKILTKDYEKEAAYHLRHQVFAEELGWVRCNLERKEIDNYDNDGVLIGVFANDKLVACLRIILPFNKFMIDEEFKNIIGDYKIQKTRKTIEVTRFCIDKAVRKKHVITKYGKFPIIMALEKAFYNWCKLNEINNVYMVISSSFFRLLNLLGMPCNPIATAVKMPDGVVALAAISHWTTFEKLSEEKRPSLLAWFKDNSCGLRML